MIVFKGLLTAVLALVAGAAVAAPKPKTDLVRVYLAPLPPPASGIVDADTKRMQDSHTDLTKKLRSQKHFEMTDSAENADATLVLTSSREEEFGRAVTGVGPGFAVTRKTLPTVRVRLTAGDYTRELMGQATWGGAAEKVAEELNTWAKDNRALLLSKRATKAGAQ